MTIGHGLLHRWPGVREAAVDLFSNLQHYLVCLSTRGGLTEQIGRQAVANMNYFHRKTFLHHLEKREFNLTMAQEQDRVRLESYSPDSQVYGGSPSTVNGNEGSYTPQGIRA